MALVALAGLAALAALATTGCEKDEGGHPLLSQPGSIGVSINDDLAAPWTITGPQESPLEGVGPVREIEVPAGEYTVEWQPLAGYATPNAQTFTVSEGRFVQIHGSYLIPPATSHDHVVANVRAAYQARNADAYTLLLAEDFLFVPADDGPAYDREAEVALTMPMFHEVQGDGGLAIGDIAIDAFDPLQVWEQVPADDPDFGGAADAWRRAYAMDLKYDIADQNLVLRVDGTVVVYAQAAAGGEYKLLGFRDLTSIKAVETHSWTEIRRMWE
jgi:hypothetical protein